MASGGILETPLARELLDEASRLGLQLSDVLAHGDDASLRPTEVAQPALLAVECVLQAELSSGSDVVAVAGHSVGEYAACVAADALPAGDAMRLVVERGRAMAAMRHGTMSAFLGMDAADVMEVCDEARRATGEVVVLANFNAPGQVVVSGTKDGVAAASSLARERGVRRVVLLNVSGAFHSPLMAEAAERFAAALDAIALTDPRVPVVCNVDAEPAYDANTLRERLRRQLTEPVRWDDSVRRMVGLGAESLVELGPGTVLTGLARRISPDVRAVSVGTLDGARGLAAVETTAS